ncbi:MAG: WYL domain-containing protein, partial [Clostridia bacterium]
MAKSAEQKAKMMLIYKMLYEKTDENHNMTVNDMIEELNAMGIKAERKSIYNDLKVLKDMGYDIIGTKSRTYSYYMGSREFQMPELKLIIDAVVSAKFLTAKKTKDLVEGLCKLTSRTMKKELVSNTGAYNRNKSTNENVYYNINSINEAIAKNA